MINELIVSQSIEHNQQNDLNILQWETPEDNIYDRIIIRRKEEDEMEYSDYSVLTQNSRIFVDSDLHGLNYIYEVVYIIHSKEINEDNEFELLDIKEQDEDLVFEDNDIEDNTIYEYLIIAKKGNETYKSQKEIIDRTVDLEE